MNDGVGRTGVFIVLILFVVLGIEDVYLWVIEGTIPGLEFFLALVIVLIVTVVAIREARTHPPSR